MVTRVVRFAFTLATLLVAAHSMVPVNARAATSGHTPLFSLTTVLGVAPELPQASKRAMTDEVERIWRRAGVTLTWRTTAPQPASAPLHVLVFERREVLTADSSQRWPVAELLTPTGHRAMAVASIAGAQRVLQEATRPRVHFLTRPEPPEYRLGVVLGRAIAHEIGHFLLATVTHANSGLMRATIDAHEFADPGSRAFLLDDTAGQWLRHRLSQSVDGSLPSGGFIYAGAQRHSRSRKGPD